MMGVATSLSEVHPALRDSEVRGLGSRYTSMHRWVGCGVISDSLINVAQYVNQRRIRGAAGHFFTGK